MRKNDEPGGGAPAATGRKPDLVGRTVGLKYRIARRLGSDSLGVHYDGEEVATARRVLVVALGGGVRVEADTACGQAHPNLVPVLDRISGAGGQRYVVLERPPGRSIASALERGERFGPGTAVGAVMQVLSALHAIHQASRYHGGLSAANVFLGRAADDTIEARVVHVGPVDFEGVPLEPWYQPPERVLGEGTADRRADLWSVGALLYEMLLGVRPFTGDSIDEITGRILLKDPPFATGDAEIPEVLREVLRRLLAKSPEERFPNVTTVLGELLLIQEDLDDRLSSATLSMIRDSLVPPPLPAREAPAAKPLPAPDAISPAVPPLAAPAPPVAPPATRSRTVDPKKTALGLPTVPAPVQRKPAPAVAARPAEIPVVAEAQPAAPAVVLPPPLPAGGPPEPLPPLRDEAEKIASALEEIEAELFPADGPGPSWTGPGGPGTARDRRRRWLPAAVAGGALVVTAAILAFAFLPGEGGPEPPDAADRALPPAPESVPAPEPVPEPEPAPESAPAPEPAPESVPAPESAAEPPAKPPPPASPGPRHSPSGATAAGTGQAKPEKKPKPGGKGESAKKTSGKTGAGYSGWASNPFGE